MEAKEELIEHARRESEEYARLEKEHRDLDARIDELFGDRAYLTPEEDLEKKKLQKQKLAKKDRMYQILKELEP
ncbi:MAG TPA: DUF465 domain-containing protein [Nitrospirota bacterium]|jgi:hypothetical protein